MTNQHSSPPPNKEESKVTPQSSSIAKAVNKNAIILGLFALVSTGLIAITYQLTKDQIAKEIELSLIRKLSEIVPEERYDNDVYNDCLLVLDETLLGSNQGQKLYRMRAGDLDVALMTTLVAPDGYSGKIMLALATDLDGELLGVNILSHNETPGLGDKIERSKSNWVKQFEGLSLANTSKEQWAVKKDGGQFDALTGATITPRAVVKSVYNGLQFVEQNKANLFELDSNCYDKGGD